MALLAPPGVTPTISPVLLHRAERVVDPCGIGFSASWQVLVECMSVGLCSSLAEICLLLPVQCRLERGNPCPHWQSVGPFRVHAATLHSGFPAHQARP